MGQAIKDLFNHKTIMTFNNETFTTPRQITNAFNKQFTDTIKHSVKTGKLHATPMQQVSECYQTQ